MKIRTGHTFSVKEGKNLNSDGNETSSAESAENSIYTTDSARRSTILSCPFNQYSRTPRLAKPVSIPTVPGIKNNDENEDSNLLSVSTVSTDNYADLDFDRILSDSRRASMSTSSTSLAASTMSSSTICEGEKNSRMRKSSGSISLTPSMARKIILPNTDDQKDCEYESIYATPTRYMPRHKQHRIRKPTSPPPPPPTTSKTSELSKEDEMNLRDPDQLRSSSPFPSHQMSKSCSIASSGHHRNNIESFKPGTSFDFLYDW